MSNVAYSEGGRHMDPLNIIIIALILGNAAVYSLVYRRKKAYEKMKQEWKQREDPLSVHDLKQGMHPAVK